MHMIPALTLRRDQHLRPQRSPKQIQVRSLSLLILLPSQSPNIIRPQMTMMRQSETMHPSLNSDDEEEGGNLGDTEGKSAPESRRRKKRLDQQHVKRRQPLEFLLSQKIAKSSGQLGRENLNFDVLSELCFCSSFELIDLAVEEA